MMKMETCFVQPGELRVTTGGSVLLETHLGSCVGVCLFDRRARVGGLAHILLPKGSKEKEALFPARYASTAIPLLLKEMARLGASRENIVAEIAGANRCHKSQGYSFLSCVKIPTFSSSL